MNKIFLIIALLNLNGFFVFAQDVSIYVVKNLDDITVQEGEFKFTSLNEAIDQAYEIAKSEKNQHISIKIQQGEYYIQKSIKIDSRLNGLTIEGAGCDEVTLKGSTLLTLKWKKQKSGIYVASLKEEINFDQFVVNGKLQTLARYPNYNEDGGYWQGYAADAISPERIAKWKDTSGAIFHAMHGGKWGGFHYLIEGIDENGEAILKGGQQNNRPSKPHKEFRMVENVLEELDAPGEWFFDKAKRKLYFMPTNDIDMSNESCEGVVLKSLIKVEGSVDNPVKDVKIEGISFTHTQRTLFEEYEQLLRSDWSIYRGSALFLSNAENCSIENCEFRDLGGNVIFVSGYNQNHRIASNHIYNCGASAICFVGEASAVRSPAFTYREFVELDEMDKVWGPKNNKYPNDCVAEDNLIYRIGRIEKQSAGVQIAMAMNITIRHNSIYDVPRAGINIGDGTWGGHILEYNDVFNTVLETGDHGSFNSWGRDRFWHPNRKVMDELVANDATMPYWDATQTTIIRNNRFSCDHGWDIDLDDGSSNYHIYNNLCLNGGIKLREGFRRVVENNITVNNAFHPHVWFENSQDVFRRNIVQDGHKDVRVAEWGREIDYNLFPNEESLMKAQVYGIDANSSFGNPEFINPEELDFSVKENSPAIKLGFVNFPMDQFGVQSPAFKKLAKTPEVPDKKKASETAMNSSPVVEWLRASIKNVESKEEQSAYGLNTAEGVIIVKIGAHSLVGVSGIKRGDVILNVEGRKVSDLKSFFATLKEYNNQEEIQVLIMRNQQEKQFKIKLK